MGIRSSSLQRSAKSQFGFTLVDLLVVLTVLGAVISLATVAFTGDQEVLDASGNSVSVREVTTRATLQEVAQSLTGGGPSGESSYLQHVGALPSRLAGLFFNVDGEPGYDVSRKRGWQGPYFTSNTVRYGDFIAAGDAFPATNLNDPAILDAWGKPVVLQEPSTDDARIVSAGPDRILETDALDATNPIRGDDIVLFLFRLDPLL